MGTVIESRIDKGAGPVATVLIQSGTLKSGDYLAIGGSLYGRVRAMKNFLGKLVTAAPPGMPVRILGFKVAPSVGDVLEVPANVKELEVHKVIKRGLGQESVSKSAAPIEESTAEKAMVNVVIRADVLGSLEAIQGMLERMVHPKVGVRVVAKGLGNISDADVLNAEANKALVLGFHVLPTPAAASMSKDKNVDVRTYKVIYDLTGDVKEEMKKLLKPEVIVTELGKLEVRGVFRIGRDFQIIGGVVIDGQVKKGEHARVRRGTELVCDGKIGELQSQKSPVATAYVGQECGIKFEGKPFIQLADVLEIYHEDKKEVALDF
jgi:translation initiation factor IF-2